MGGSGVFSGVMAGGEVIVSSSSSFFLCNATSPGGRFTTLFPVCCSAFPLVAKQARRPGGEALRSSASYHVLPPRLLSWAATPQKCRKALCCTAALGFEVTPATVVALSSVLSFAAVRTYVYFRMEYIIAAMLGRHVPRGGAKVVELNIRGGRNLYYYPADTVQVVAVSSKPNVQLLENQAVRAGVPIQINTKGPAALGVPSSSMDAVVSVFCLRDISDKEILNVLREAVRVLKPGKTLQETNNESNRGQPPSLDTVTRLLKYVHPPNHVDPGNQAIALTHAQRGTRLQNSSVVVNLHLGQQSTSKTLKVGGKNLFIRSVQSVVEGLLNLVGTKRATTRNLLPYFQEVGDLEEVDYEEVFSFVDPHVVGVAKKKLSIDSEPPPSKATRKGLKKSKA